MRTQLTLEDSVIRSRVFSCQLHYNVTNQHSITVNEETSERNYHPVKKLYAKSR